MKNKCFLLFLFGLLSNTAFGESHPNFAPCESENQVSENNIMMPDLEILSITTSSDIVNNFGTGIEILVANHGDGEAANPYLNVWLSKDEKFAPGDNRVYGSSIPTIPANDTLLVSFGYNHLFSSTISGSGFLIAHMDYGDRIQEINEGNNVLTKAVQIKMPQPPASCTKIIGVGAVLCVKQAGDFVQLFAEQPNGKIQEYQVDTLGNSMPIGDAYFLYFDSLFVRNDTLVKIREDSSIVFERPIPSAIFDTIQFINKVFELRTGEFVFAGSYTETVNINWTRQFLNFVKTDSNFSILDIKLPFGKSSSSTSSTDYYYDRIDWAALNDSGKIEIAKVHIRYQDQRLRFYTLNEDLSIQRKSSETIAAAFSGFTTTPCGNLRIGSRLSPPIGFSGISTNKVTWIDSDNRNIIQDVSITGGVVSRFGYAHSFSFEQVQPIEVILRSFSFGEGREPPPIISISSNANGIKDSLLFDFFPFQTGFKSETGPLMLFGRTNDSLWVSIIKNCPPATPTETSFETSGCESVFWNGQEFQSDTTFVEYRQGALRDTNLTVNIIVLENSDTNIVASICEGEMYLNYSESGVYEDTLMAFNGCDSVRRLELTVFPIDETELNLEISEGDSIFGVPVLSDTVFVENLLNGFGCDSVVITNVSVKTTSTFDAPTNRNLGFVVFPNPTFGDAYLISKTPKTVSTKIQLFNVMGVRLFSDEFLFRESGEIYSVFRIHEELPKGIYFLKLEVNGVSVLKKIIRQ